MRENLFYHFALGDFNSDENFVNNDTLNSFVVNFDKKTAKKIQRVTFLPHPVDVLAYLLSDTC